MTNDGALIWCPFADAGSARTVIGQLLDERLIACANVLPGVRSDFVWQGKRGEGDEVGVLFKTTARRLDAAMHRLEVLHPYEQPAITGWTVRASAATLAWLDTETQGD